MAIPLKMADEAVFARLKETLIKADYTEASIIEYSKGDNLAFEPFEDERVPPDQNAAELLIGLFLRLGEGTESQFRQVLGDQAWDDFSSVGLVSNVGDDRIQAQVRLRPMYGVYAVSDKWSGEQRMADDVVFPPDTPHTLRYLAFVPQDSCDTFLEACGGSGIAAVLARKNYAKQAWSFDIAPRSTFFADFNGRLNGLPIETGTGDTYEPAAGMMFDRIAVHPPYVPVLRHTYLYHDGGADGEQITRKHIEDLHKVLKPGGWFFCRCLATDRVGEPFEQRVRSWLGEHSNEFDIGLHVFTTTDPVKFLSMGLVLKTSNTEDLPAWDKQFAAMKLKRFVSAAFVIQRHDSPREPFTFRRDKGAGSGPQHFQWLMKLETLLAKNGPATILNTRLKVGEMMLQRRHVVDEGKWALEKQLLETLQPYPLTWEADSIAVYLLPKLSEPQTGMQLFRALEAEGAFRGGGTPDLFALGLGQLIRGGFIHMEGHEPPPWKDEEISDH
jgi:hypothetical protein